MKIYYLTEKNCKKILCNYYIIIHQSRKKKGEIDMSELLFLQDYTIELLQYERSEQLINGDKAFYYIDNLVTPALHNIASKIAQYTSNHRFKRSPMQIELVFDTPLVSDNVFSIFVNREMTEIVFYMHSPSVYSETKTLAIKDPTVFNEQDIWLEFAKMLAERKVSLEQEFGLIPVEK